MKYGFILILLSIFTFCGKAKSQAVNDTTTAPKKEAVFAEGRDAYYPGGDDKLLHYLDSAIVYPPKAKQHKIEGRVILISIIEKDGHLSNVRAFRSPDVELSNEAIRVVKDLIFIPAVGPDGKLIRQRYTLPVNFYLDKSKRKRKNI